MLLGDFNSVTTSFDHLSGKLDDISHFLHTSLTQWKPPGSHRYSFTYHHPAVPNRKSRLDRIYLNFEMNNTRGYSQHSSISDHYLVSLYQLPDKDKGPKLWRLLDDALNNSQTCMCIDLTLSNFNYQQPLSSWEDIKVKLQTLVQLCTKFRQKQIKQDLKGMQMSLRCVNKLLYEGKNMEQDHLHLQSCVCELQRHMWFASDDNDWDIDWIMHEGKMVKSFLHLEDVHVDLSLHEVHSGNTVLSSSEEVLPILHAFYSFYQPQIRWMRRLINFYSC